MVLDHCTSLKADLVTLADSVLSPNDTSLPKSVHQSADMLCFADSGAPLAMHRFVLCAHSDCFLRALLGSFQEATTGEIHLAASPEAVAAACEWVHLDQWKVEPTPELCVELMELACHLMLPRLAALAGAFLAPHMDLDDVFDVPSLGCFCQLEKLEDCCPRAVALQIEEVARVPDRKEALKRTIQEEARGIAQKEDVDVVDTPLVADMKKMMSMFKPDFCFCCCC